MIQPKVKASYASRDNGLGATYYGGIDLTDYNNDVKTYTRKIEVFRTDTNALIVSLVLTKDEFQLARTVQDGNYPAAPYLNDLPIKAVLTITDADGVDYVAEDSIVFVSLNTSNPTGVVGISRKRTLDGDFFSVIDNTEYPLLGRDKSEFSRYIVVSRRATSLPVTRKIEYIKELIDPIDEIEFSYFNEYVVVVQLIWIHKATNQLYEYITADYVNMNADIDQFYNEGGIYTGAAGGDPLSNEDAVPDLSVLLPLPTVVVSSRFFRPHILTYTTPGTPGGVDGNGFPLPDYPGEVVTVPCRFHQEHHKVFRNEDSIEVAQIGTIRLGAGVVVPKVGTIITVTNVATGTVQFKGPVRERYEATLSGRLEV